MNVRVGRGIPHGGISVSTFSEDLGAWAQGRGGRLEPECGKGDKQIRMKLRITRE